MDEQNPVPMSPPPAAPSAYMQMTPVGRLLSGSWNFYKNHFAALFSLVVIFFIVNALPLLSRVFPEENQRLMSSTFTLVSGIIGVIVGIAIIAFVIDNGNTPGGAINALTRGRQLFWQYFWAGILVGLVVGGGFLLLIVPGIVMCIMLAFTSYVLVGEGKRGLSALAQSWHYVKGHGWPVFGRLFVLGIIYLLPLMILGFLFDDFSSVTTDPSDSSYATASIPSVLATSFIVALWEPFAVIYMFMMYNELKQMKGDMDETMLQSRTKKLRWLALLGVAVILAFVVLIILSISYFTTMLQDPGTASGAFKFIF